MNFSEGKDIWISPYTLRANHLLNSLSGRTSFQGVLIKIGEGYSCLHPWIELGDPSLEKCLDDLAGRQFWPIVRRAIRLAEYDDAARREEESLFEEMEIPRSHATLVAKDLDEVSNAVTAGFDTVKIKFGRELKSEISFLKDAAIAHPEISWRIDCNEQFSVEQAKELLSELKAPLLQKIDFIEDPTPYSGDLWATLWKQYRVPLAVDAECSVQSRAAQVAVIKPAVDEPFLLCEAAIQAQQRAVFTSYMDHPVGQAFAAWEAARMELIFPGLVGLCGLQTHHLFQKNAFIEALGEWKPEFTAPGGIGIGFNDILGELPWKKLS